MDLFQKCKDYTLAQEVKEAGIYPYFHTLESKQDIVVEMEGKILTVEEMHRNVDKYWERYIRAIRK